MSETEPQAGQLPESELLWREYQLSVDLYKSYLDIVVKVVVGYYAVTGGILSFYFSSKKPAVARWALVLPCLVSVALAWIFLWGASLWEITRNDAFKIARKLGLMSAFELSALQMFLRGSAVLLIITGVGMVLLIIL